MRSWFSPARTRILLIINKIHIQAWQLHFNAIAISILIKVQCVVYQWILLNKLYKLLDFFFFNFILNFQKCILFRWKRLGPSGMGCYYNEN